MAGDGGGGAVDERWGVGGDFSQRGEQVLFAVRAGEAEDSAGDGRKHGRSVARRIQNMDRGNERGGRGMGESAFLSGTTYDNLRKVVL